MPRNQALSIFIRLCGTKLILTIISSALSQYRNYTEGKIKKRLRQKMTLLLLESFLSLDYSTQNNAMIMRDFTSASTLVNGSIIGHIAEIMRLLAYSLRAVIICFSFASQIHHQERSTALPFIGIWLLIDASVKQCTP
jgi:hypothetical protein